MKPLSSLSLKINVYNESLLKMKTAPLITKIIDSMLKKSQGTLNPEKRKIFMYVGHDSTVVNFLEGLKIWDMQIPNYNIMAIVELHEDDLGYHIQVNK
jgi:prostatic aicd phosphatase